MQLTELRKTVFLLNDRFVTKDTVQEQPNGRGAQGKVGGVVQSFHALYTAFLFNLFETLDLDFVFIILPAFKITGFKSKD